MVDWNLDNNAQREHAELKAREMVVSSDGNFLLTSDNNGTLSVWTTGNFRLVCELQYNVWEPETLIRSDDTNGEDISPHDSTLYSVPIHSTDNDRVQISALICGENDRYFCTGKEDGTVTIFDLDTAKHHRKLLTHSSSVSVTEMTWSRNQRYFASVDDSGRLIAKRLEKPSSQQGAKWKVLPLLDLRLGIAVTQLLFSSSEEFLLVASGPWDRIYSTKKKEKLCQISRQDGMPKRWVQHPADSQLLIAIEGEEHALYKWSTLEKFENDSSGLGFDRMEKDVTDLGSLIIEEEPLEIALGKTASANAAETMNTLEHVFLLQDRYLVLEFLSNRKYSPTTLHPPPASHRIEMIDLKSTSASASHHFRRTHLPLIACTVNRLIGTTQGHLVFLNHQY